METPKISLTDFVKKYVVVKGNNNFPDDRTIKMCKKIDDGYEMKLIKSRGGSKIVMYKKKVS